MYEITLTNGTDTHTYTMKASTKAYATQYCYNKFVCLYGNLPTTITSVKKLKK
jgi:hypothetical protein